VAHCGYMYDKKYHYQQQSCIQKEIRNLIKAVKKLNIPQEYNLPAGLHILYGILYIAFFMISKRYPAFFQAKYS